jgi:hypothetical protein
LKPIRADLIKASSMAIGLVMVITVLGYYVLPPYIFVSPGYSVYVAGIVDHKKIGQGFDAGQPITWYTVSIRLFEDDLINRIKSGETLAYIVTKSDWDVVEWGDTVKIRLLADLRAEIVELFPFVKLPEWREPFLRGLHVELLMDKTTYRIGEKANFSVRMTNVQQETSGNLAITLFKTFPFWTFQDGKKIFSSPNYSETQDIVLQPSQELKSSFEWELVDVPKGVYYVRVYLGYFTDNQENTLTGTTMLGIVA